MLASWLKLGLVSFGGPAGQIALMHQELVERKRWISDRRFLHALNFCMLLPGPEAQQLATYIGWLLNGTWGGVLAGTLFVLPSLLVLIALAWIYLAFGHLVAVVGVFYGVKPAVIAIVVYAAYRIGSRILRNVWMWAVASMAFVAIFGLGLPFPIIIVSAALVGYIGGTVSPASFTMAEGHRASAKSFGPAVIDDDTPPPKHAQFAWRGVAIAVIGCLGLWTTGMVALGLASGWNSLLTQMAWFFTKAALLTFGGAYAVLPYVYQGAVEHFHWLTAPQMIDGLALGETTPGPLIMVVAFVGFVGAWTKAIFGPGSLFLAGAAAACVVTFYTFLPSFLFILVGGPFIESTHDNMKFTAPLAAISAAVVGVIANLAAFFADHVFWPQGSSGPWDWTSALLALCSATALIRFKIGVVPVIVGSGLAGLAMKMATGS